jgi:nuclear pore complex protein Nup188
VGEYGLYDIKEIKSDASWLANEAKIDLAAALRIVMLEFQSRPRRLALSTLSEKTTIVDGAGDLVVPSSSFFSQSSTQRESQSSNDANEKFLSEESRQSRLLRIYLDERLHVLKTTDALIRHYVETRRNVDKSSLYDTAKAICTTVCRSELATSSIETCLYGFMGALKQRMNRLEAGSGWFAKDGGREDLEALWQQNQVDEIVPILQLSLYVALTLTPSSKSAVAYFSLLSDRCFFQFDGVSLPDCSIFAC